MSVDYQGTVSDCEQAADGVFDLDNKVRFVNFAFFSQFFNVIILYILPSIIVLYL